MPYPNARFIIPCSRAGSNTSGVSTADGSRFADASSRRTIEPAGISVPESVTGSVVMRMIRWNEGFVRSTCSTKGAMADLSSRSLVRSSGRCVRVGGRRFLGKNYELYDVWTEDERWWVITNLTNLYSQDEFPSIENAFTFHIGLMMRMGERDQVEPDEDRKSFLEPAWRRFRAAAGSMETAREAEDFQAIASDAVRRSRLDTCAGRPTQGF